MSKPPEQSLACAREGTRLRRDAIACLDETSYGTPRQAPRTSPRVTLLVLGALA